MLLSQNPRLEVGDSEMSCPPLKRDPEAWQREGACPGSFSKDGPNLDHDLVSYCHLGFFSLYGVSCKPRGGRGGFKKGQSGDEETQAPVPAQPSS